MIQSMYLCLYATTTIQFSYVLIMGKFWSMDHGDLPEASKVLDADSLEEAAVLEELGAMEEQGGLEEQEASEELGASLEPEVSNADDGFITAASEDKDKGEEIYLN